MRRLSLLPVLLLMTGSTLAQEIVLRHALPERALDTLATLVLRFNDAQKGKAPPRIVLESLDGVANRQVMPHLALLDDDDARDFFDTRPRFRPLVEVMKQAREKFDARRLLPQIADAVDDLRGQPQGLPLAMTLPVLFYNKEAFVKAGLDPEQPPKTWWEVQRAAGALFDAGQQCPLTSSRFAWVHLENTASQHDQPVVVRSGPKDRFAFDSLVHVKHIALLASWYKSRYFHYFGPGREGDGHFLSGECAMLTGESGLVAGWKDRAPFPVGVAELPYYEDVFGSKPGQVLPDGAALWILPGKKKEEYKVVARFIAFLLRPEVQREWVRATGFLPMTAAALDELQAAGVPPAVVAAARKRLSMPRQGNARARVGFGRSRLRAILNEEMDFVWKNLKPAKEALDTAMRRAGEEDLPPRQ